MQVLASAIKKQKDVLINEYVQRLREIDAYTEFSIKALNQVALEDLELVVQCLEAEDDADFVQFTRNRVTERIAQGFSIAPLMQALTSLEDTLIPPVTANASVDAATFLWRALSHIRQDAALQTWSKLRESESHFRQTVQGLLVGVFRATGEGQILQANPAFLQALYLESVEQANDIGWPMMFEDESDWVHFSALLSQGPIFGFEVRLFRTDGQVIFASVGARLVYDQQGLPLYLEGTLEEISTRKRSELALEQRAAQLTMLNRFARNVTLIFNQQELFQQTVDIVRQDLGYLQVAVLLVDQEDDEFYVAAATDNLWQIIPDGYRQPVDKGAVGIAAQTGQPVLVQDAAKDSRVDKNSAWLSPSFLCVPITIGERVIGVLLVEADKPDAFDENDIAVIGTLADQVAVAVENVRLYEAVQQELVERKKAEVAFEEQHEFLRQVIDAVPSYIFVKDSQGRFVLVNQALAAVYSIKVDKMIGKTDAELGIEQAERFRRDDIEVLESQKEKFIPEEMITNREGNVRWVQTTKRPLISEDGVAYQVLGVVNDITERKMAEQALEEQRAFLRQTIDVNPNFVFVRDREGRFILANKAVAQAYGVSVEDLLGKTDADFNPNLDQVERARQDDLQVMDSLQEKVVSEGEITDADGNVRWLQTIKRPLIDEDGIARRILGVSSDITEQMRLRQQLAALLERRAEQVRTVTQVAQEIAALPGLEDLYSRTVTLIKERFGYYHAQIFRYEPGLDAVILVAGYGEAGEQMLAEGLYMQMGQGVVGSAAAKGRPVLAADLAQVAKSVTSAYLPDTKGQLAIPIVLRHMQEGGLHSQVLGILDVHSDVAGALSEDDQLLLEGLCGQIAIIIEEIRLRQEMEERLQELRFMYRALSREGWETYRQQADLPEGYLFDRTSIQTVSDLWLPEIGQAAERQEAVVGAEHSPVVVTPVQAHGEVIGVLGVYDDPLHPLSADDLALLEAVSEQTSLALESARLFEDARTRAEEQTALSEMGRALAAELDIEAIFENVYLHIARLLDASNFYIALYNDDTQQVSFPLVTQEGERIRWRSRRLGKGLTEHVINTKEPVLILENIESWLSEMGIETIGIDAQSWLGVPVMIGQQVLGVIAVQSYTTPRRYNQHHCDLLVAVASQSAVAIQNARSFEQARARAEEQTILSEMGRMLAMALDQETILENIYSYTSRLMDTNSFYIALYDAKAKTVSFPLFIDNGERVERQTRPAREGGVTEYVLQSRESLLIKEDVIGWVRAQGIQVIGTGAQSWLGTPMVRGEQVIGVVVVQHDTIPYLYNEHHRDLLVAVANQSAIAIENVRMIKGTQIRAQREQLLRQVTNRLRTPPDVDGVLRVLVQELGQVLGRRTFVHLGSQIEQMPAQDLNGDDGGRA